MELFKNGIGRPSNEVLKKRKYVKIAVVFLIIIVIGIIGFLVYRSNFSKGKLEGDKLNVAPVANKFVAVSNGNNCYTVYAPTNAQNWRLQVYYKKKGVLSYGSNKIISKDHYNDKVKSQKVCFTKQKYDEETFRILVKWTTGANDKTYKTVRLSSWKPTGWNHNPLTGWAYEDFDVSWNKTTNNNNSNNSNNNNNSSALPTITFKPQSGSINSKGVVQVTSANNYSTKVTITNTSGKTYYFRWFTYGNHNISSKPTYNGVTYNNEVCVAFSSKKEISVGLNVSKSYPKRAGQIKIYSNLNSCKSDSVSTSTKDVVTKKSVYYTLSGVVSIVTQPEVKAASNGISSVTKEKNYTTTFILNNTTGKTYYYRWFTYSTHNTNTKPSYNKSSCVAFSDIKTTSPKLGVSMTSRNRAGQIKVYSTQASCTNDNNSTNNTNVVAKAVVKYSLVRKFTNSDRYMQLTINPSTVLNSVGKQKKGSTNCWSLAMAYGVYILSDGKTKASTTSTAWSSYNVGSYTAVDGSTSSVSTIWTLIKKKIGGGIPVVLQVKNQWSATHWVLVYGYNVNAGNVTSESVLMKNIKVIDPTGSYGVANRIDTAKTLHSSRATRTWNKK